LKPQLNEAQMHMIKELLFDLSSGESTVRANAIRALIPFATCEGIEEAVKQRYSLEQDRFCKHGLEEILKICASKSENQQIRLVDKPFTIASPAPSAPAVVSAKPLSKTAAPLSVKKIGPDALPGVTALQQPKIEPEPQADIVPEPQNTPVDDGSGKDLHKPFKKKFAYLLQLLRTKLEWAAQNNVVASEMGMGIILAVLIFFAIFTSYSIIRGGEKFSFSDTQKSASRARIPGEIQTEEISPGKMLKGTLKEYDLFAQSWFFLSDDEKLFKIKLDKAPGFYKVEDKLNVLVESCEKNTRGHLVLVGKVEGTY